MKLTLSTGLFDHIKIDKLPNLLPLLHEAGFRYLEAVDRVEFDNNGNILDELRVRAKDHGIEIPNWHLTQYSPFQGNKAINKAAMDCMKRSIEKGVRVGAKNHVLHWFHRFSDKDYDAMWRDIVDEWTDCAKSQGARLLMETVPDKPSNQRYVLSSEIMDFVKNYPPEVLSICIDINHSNLKEKLPYVIEELKDRLISLHISDNDGHSEQHWLPGQGVINFPVLFNSLEAIEFAGTLVWEVNKWCKKPEELSKLKQLYEFARNLLESKETHPGTPLLGKTQIRSKDD